MPEKTLIPTPRVVEHFTERGWSVTPHTVRNNAARLGGVKRLGRWFFDEDLVLRERDGWSAGECRAPASNG